MSEALSDIGPRVVRWQRLHGRHDLPWQGRREPYRVWLSEIMLQQTQVVTVMGYFERFVRRFPDVHSLAQAPLDDVLALWSGLGYYSRARNLHACAQAVVTQFGGVFPADPEALKRLPGIGPSTAAAIASMCFSQRAAILDGNVKRVLSRALGFEGDLASSVQEKKLWALACEVLPQAADMPTYTQGVMDLGATVCTTRKPRCSDCPLQSVCVAHAQGQPERYPVKTRKLKRSAQSIWLLCARNDQGQYWLSPRPTPGVWAGLYCFECFESEAQLAAQVAAQVSGASMQALPALKHVLTHKDLHLHPVVCHWTQSMSSQPLSPQGRWVSLDESLTLGLPAPIKSLLLSF